MLAFAQGEFQGSLARASAYLRDRGIEKKGMSKRPRKRGRPASGLDIVAAQKKRKAAGKHQRRLKQERLVAEKRGIVPAEENDMDDDAEESTEVEMGEQED